MLQPTTCHILSSHQNFNTIVDYNSQKYKFMIFMIETMIRLMKIKENAQI